VGGWGTGEGRTRKGGMTGSDNKRRETRVPARAHHQEAEVAVGNTMVGEEDSHEPRKAAEEPANEGGADGEHERAVGVRV
jgi:hypothetical protein